MIQKMLMICAVYLSGAATVLWAEPVVTVSSEPPLPLQNLVKDSSFEESSPYWDGSKGLAKNNEFVETTQFSGKKSYKISGDVKEKPYVLQQIFLPEAIPAGTPMYIGVASKAEGIDPTLTKPTVALHVESTGGADSKGTYVSTPPIPGEDHDWTWCELTGKTTQPVKSMSLVLCFYNQKGCSFWDDVIIKIGAVKLNVEVKGQKLKQVRVFNSKTGLVFDSGVMANQPDAFAKSLTAPGFGAYYVEAEDASGAVAGSRYPENEDSPAAMSPDSIPVFKRFNAEIFNKPARESYTVELPDLNNKEVFLDLSARLGGVETVAGFTSALWVAVNDTALNVSNLMPPKNDFTMSCGQVANYFSADGMFIVYYAPWEYALSTENVYCQVSKENKNPFKYKFNITPLVKPGKNKITLGNGHQKAPMFIANCKVSVVDKAK